MSEFSEDWGGSLKLPWDVIDLQIYQRARRVGGSTLTSGRLRLRAGDFFRFQVRFIDADKKPVDPGLTSLRWSLREASNLEEVVTVESTPPVVQSDADGPCFYLEPDIARIKTAGLDLLPTDDKELACVADFDWTIEGEVRSSMSFPVTVEFGLTQQVISSGKDEPPPLPPLPPPSAGVPVITGSPTILAPQGALLTSNLQATNEPTSWTKVSGPTWVTLSNSGELSIKATRLVSGVGNRQNCVVTATNAAGSSAPFTVSIVVVDDSPAKTMTITICTASGPQSVTVYAL